MISTKKEKALMGCLIPQRNAADLRRSGRCKGAGLKIPWKLHWREKRRKTYRPPEQKRRKSGESEQGISKPDEKKKSMRTEGQYCIQPSVSKKSSAAKKKRKRNCPHRALQNDYTFEAHDEKKFRPAEKEQWEKSGEISTGKISAVKTIPHCSSSQPQKLRVDIHSVLRLNHF